MSKPAIFLDRDGVLTVEKSYVRNKDELEIFPYAAECVSYMKQKGFYTIVITNQSGVARGFFTEKDLIEMNSFLQEKTGVDYILYCPHYEQGSVRKYAIKCKCRKPQAGMIMQACDIYDIDITKSYMVGDRASDILCGKKAGVQTVLLESGYGSKKLEIQITPDYIYKDLREFIVKI